MNNREYKKFHRVSPDGAWEMRNIYGEIEYFKNEASGVLFQPGEEWKARAHCMKNAYRYRKFLADFGGNESKAKRVCGKCKVKTECILHALNQNRFDLVRGGLGTNQLLALAREREG